MAWTKEQNRVYQAAWREKNREKLRERKKEWWRAKHGSVPRAEYLAKVKSDAALKREQRKADKEAARKTARESSVIQPVRPPPKEKPARRAVDGVRKPGRLLAMAGFVRNW